jgi:hypothetical protein
MLPIMEPAAFGAATIATWVTNVIYTLMLGVLIWQIVLLRKQVKSQEGALYLQAQAIRQSDYLRCQTDFTDMLRLLISTKLHNVVYDNLAARAALHSRGGPPTMRTSAPCMLILRFCTSCLSVSS